jgi:hypothetical protein
MNVARWVQAAENRFPLAVSLFVARKTKEIGRW